MRSQSAPSTNGYGQGGSANANGNFAKKKKRRLTVRRKRTLDPGIIIDYKSPEILKRFITDRGKIIPRRISGATAAQQRRIALAVKRARFLALLPSSVSHETERGFAGDMQNIAQAFSAASVRARSHAPRPGGPGGDRGERFDRGERPERNQAEGHDRHDDQEDDEE